jgi:hypothetical protein
VRQAGAKLGGCAPSRPAGAGCLAHPEEHLSVLLIGDVPAAHWQKLPASSSPQQILDALRRNFLPRREG